jgi:transposase
MANRLRWHLHRIGAGDPAADPPAHSLDRAKVRLQLAGWLTDKTGIDARLAREVLADIDRITPTIDALEREITTLAKNQAAELLTGRGSLARVADMGTMERRTSPVRIAQQLHRSHDTPTSYPRTFGDNWRST